MKEYRLKKAKRLVKTEYVIHIRNLKQTFNHGLAVKKWHRLLNLNKRLG